MNTRFRINHPGVIHEYIDEEVLVLNLAQGSYYRLHDVAAQLWKGIASDQPLGLILETMESRYSAGRDRLALEVGGYLEEFQGESLIVPEPEVIEARSQDAKTKEERRQQTVSGASFSDSVEGIRQSQSNRVGLQKFINLKRHLVPGFSREEHTPLVSKTFFWTVYRAFQQAEQAAGQPIDRFLRVGGHTIRLRFGGTAFPALINPALEHLVVEPVRRPDLTLCIWDDTSSGTQMPPTIGNTDLLMTLALGPSLGLFWMRDASEYQDYDRSVPLRFFFHAWLAHHGGQLVHAASVGTRQGGVLLSGPSGAGKSTAALACLEGGLGFIGDEYSLVLSEPRPSVCTVYRSARLNAANRWRFPRLTDSLDGVVSANPDFRFYFLKERYPHQLLTGVPLKAIAIVRAENQVETRLRSASAAEVLASIAPTTIFQLPAFARQTMAKLCELVRRVPGYVLQTGTRLSEIPRTVSGLLTSLS